MTKSIATASINRETAVALIDAALAAARAIGIPAAVAVVDATGNPVSYTHLTLPTILLV